MGREGMVLTDPVYRSRMADTPVPEGAGFPPGPPLRERVVVGVAAVDSYLAVVCQDGTVFRQTGPGDWYEADPIPGTPRWYQVTGEQMDAEA